MKKHLFLLIAVALTTVVACEKEAKDKAPGGDTEQPSDGGLSFNRLAPIYLPIAEGDSKGGKYDAMTIYDNAVQIRCMGHDIYYDIYGDSVDVAIPYGIDCGWMTGYYNYRDTVAKEFAIKGDHAVAQDWDKDSEGKVWKLVFPTSRDIVAVVLLNEDGSVFDLTEGRDIDFYEFMDNGWDGHELERRLYDKWNEAWERELLDTVGYIPNAVMDSMQPLMQRALDKGNESGDWKELLSLFKNGYYFIPLSGGAEYRELVAAGKN